jgi:hypothetical protein
MNLNYRKRKTIAPQSWAVSANERSANMNIRFPAHLTPRVADAVKELLQTVEQSVAHLPKPWLHFWVSTDYPANNPSVVFKVYSMEELFGKPGGEKQVYLCCRNLLGGEHDAKTI